MEVPGLKASLRGLLLVAAIAAAGCNAAPGPTPATTSSNGHRVMLDGSIDTTGDAVITGSFTTRPELQLGPLPTPAPSSITCGEYAKGAGNAKTFVSPEIHTTGNPNVYFRAMVGPGYSGPGTYTTDNAPGLTGSAIVSTEQGQGPSLQMYNTRHGGTTTLIVAADGSGTLSFTRWGTDEVRQGNIAGHLWGTIRWICR